MGKTRRAPAYRQLKAARELTEVQARKLDRAQLRKIDRIIAREAGAQLVSWVPSRW